MPTLIIGLALFLGLRRQFLGPATQACLTHHFFLLARTLAR
jgi:hypothetical protein